MLSEYQLVQNVIPHLNQEYQAFEEVKIFSRSIDLVLKKNEEIISIEFKLSNWGKAFKQISDYQIVSDYSYLCIPKKKLSDKTLKKLISRGIGLF